MEELEEIIVIVGAIATEDNRLKRQILRKYYNNITFLLQRRNIVVFFVYLLYNKYNNDILSDFKEEYKYGS